MQHGETGACFALCWEAERSQVASWQHSWFFMECRALWAWLGEEQNHPSTGLAAEWGWSRVITHCCHQPLARWRATIVTRREQVSLNEFLIRNPPWVPSSWNVARIHNKGKTEFTFNITAAKGTVGTRWRTNYKRHVPSLRVEWEMLVKRVWTLS